MTSRPDVTWNDGVHLGTMPRCLYDSSCVQVSELVNFNQKLYIVCIYVYICVCVSQIAPAKFFRCLASEHLSVLSMI